MSQYDEVRATYSSSSSEAFYRNLGREGCGSGSFNMAIVRPSPADFIADVELAARAALVEPEYVLFKRIYINKIEIPEAVQVTAEYIRVKNTIMAKVGKMFVDRHIHPTSQYFKPVDTR